MKIQPAFHPLADLFPLMEGAEFDALAADIKAHGLREPIILLDDQILDGRNRYRACEVADVEPIYQDWDNSGDPRAFVISKNLHRRHLNESQRAMIAAKLANIKLGEVGGGHEKTGMHLSIPDAAALLNVSPTTVHNAKTVIKGGTREEIAAVESGDAGVKPIAEQIRAKVPPAKRAQRRSEPMASVGKNPERIQRQQINAEVWGRIRDALTNLTNLPLPSDVVSIVRANDRTGLVDARCAQALQWLKDFSDAWRKRDQNAA